MGEATSNSATQWSLILRAQGEGPRARAAMGQLIQRYEHSIENMIRYSRRPPNQTPEEIKQEFLTRVLERDDIAALHSSRGSFRGWLRQAVKRHLLNDWDHWHAQKNPDAKTDYPDVFDAACGENPDQIIDRKFDADTLKYVVERLRATSPDKLRFEALKRFVPGPDLSLDAIGPTAESLDMTATALRIAIYRERKRFDEFLTEAVADTLDIDLADPAGRAEVEREKCLIYRRLYEPSSLQVQILSA